MFNTKIQRAASGKEYRAAFMLTPLTTFKLPYEFLRDASSNLEVQQLVGFWRARLGSFDSFLHTDPADCVVTDQNFGTGTGSAAVFPLIRTYGAGGFTADDFVQNVNSITNIKDNGTPVVQGAGAGKYTIDSLGNVTFGTAPTAGHALTWSGAYYYRCRFLVDTLDYRNFMVGLWDLSQLQFIGAPQNKV
jgi:uncharacterized protein (TIGR02217 family)